jgi:predicted NUDIX family NTP pyrophosphohydrolase
MASRSAGILLYKRSAGELLVRSRIPVVRSGRSATTLRGRYPKVNTTPARSRRICRREFREELGSEAAGILQPLGEIIQKGGKHVIAFALEGDFDAAGLQSNTFEIEWPPRSGRLRTFPEVDRIEWMTLSSAREKILPSQATFLDRLLKLLG